MTSFLITFKPASENPERGWPLEDFLRLVRRKDEGQRVAENWRFANRKEATLGDRVFLLLQGRGGPAIIGYGTVASKPNKSMGRLRSLIEFESILDPSLHALANRDDLRAIEADYLWKTESSGIKLPASVADALEKLVVGKYPKPASGKSDSNPDWVRDELIIALNFYLRYRPNPPGKDSKEIRELSDALNRLGEKLYPPNHRGGTSRNANGVYMKLMNFRRFDPEYTAAGRTGLARGAKAEEDVWKEFANDASRCRAIAVAIIASVDDPEVPASWLDPSIDEGIQEAEEGRLLTRKHFVRERNRKLVESKRTQALRKHGRLVCQICEFDFETRYGNRGKGFIECHHTKPVATLIEGHKTHLDDLALVCANCHRIIHRTRPWLSVGDARKLLDDTSLRNKTTNSARVDAQPSH